MYAKLKTILPSIQNNRNCSTVCSVHCALQAQSPTHTHSHTRWTVEMRNRKRTQRSTLARRVFVCTVHACGCIYVINLNNNEFMWAVICAKTLLNIWMASIVLGKLYVHIALIFFGMYWIGLTFRKYSQSKHTATHTHTNRYVLYCICLSFCRIYFSSIKMIGRGGGGSGGNGTDGGRP